MCAYYGETCRMKSAVAAGVRPVSINRVEMMNGRKMVQQNTFDTKNLCVRYYKSIGSISVFCPVPCASLTLSVA